MKINAIPAVEAAGNAFGYSYLRKTILEGLEGLGAEIVYDDSEICPVMLAVNDPGGFYKHSREQSLVAYTMFETTVLPPHMTQAIYACNAVMVPSSHNLCMIRDSGLDLTAAVIPMGIDPELYAHYNRPEGEEFTFLWNGATNTRKGFLEAYRAFCDLAPEMPDARLVIKTTPNPRHELNIETPREVGEVAQQFLRGIADAGGVTFRARAGVAEEDMPIPSFNLGEIHTEGVTLVNERVTLEEMRDIYYRADCFVFPSKGEADIGLTALEAMATGLPVIATEWLFRDSDYPGDCYYPLKYERKKAEYCTGYWGTCGDWAVPDYEHLKELMLYAYNHREKGRAIGARASAWVHANRTWRHTIGGVYDFLATR